MCSKWTNDIHREQFFWSSKPIWRWQCSSGKRPTISDYSCHSGGQLRHFDVTYSKSCRRERNRRNWKVAKKTLTLLHHFINYFARTLCSIKISNTAKKDTDWKKITNVIHFQRLYEKTRGCCSDLQETPRYYQRIHSWFKNGKIVHLYWRFYSQWLVTSATCSITRHASW